MATSGYVGELQPTSQPQGTGVSVTTGQTSTSDPSTPQFLAEIQTTVTTPPTAAPAGQTTPPDQAPPTPSQNTTPPTQTQYVTAEIQSSPTQSGNAQSTPQYIVVTVTGEGPKSLYTFHSYTH